MRLYVIGADGQIARSLRERAGYIDRNQIAKLGLALGKSDYAKYVQALADRAP